MVSLVPRYTHVGLGAEYGARVCQPPMPTHSRATSTVCLPHNFFDYIITTEPMNQLNPVVFACTNKEV